MKFLWRDVAWYCNLNQVRSKDRKCQRIRSFQVCFRRKSGLTLPTKSIKWRFRRQKSLARESRQQRRLHYGSEDRKQNIVLRSTQWPWYIILKILKLNCNSTNSGPIRIPIAITTKLNTGEGPHIRTADLLLVMLKFLRWLTCILAKRMIIAFDIFSRYVEHLWFLSLWKVTKLF